MARWTPRGIVSRQLMLAVAITALVAVVIVLVLRAIPAAPRPSLGPASSSAVTQQR